jgi:cell division inhibitor SulA
MKSDVVPTPGVEPSALPPILQDMETEPIRSDWLLLTPDQRLQHVWQMRSRLVDLEQAHDERSLPEL